MSPVLAARTADLRFSHDYAAKLIDVVPRAEWSTSPGGVTTIAWQVGHLAMATHRLVLERACGLADPAASGLPPAYLKLFGRDSVPGAADTPPQDELRRVFQAVHARALEELAARPGRDLDAPAHSPHAFCRTVGDCLQWASHHEMLHAGQIAVVRRQLGHPPLW